MKPSLRIVKPQDRPLAKLSQAEKLAQAKAYVQRKGIYILDKGTPKPKWGRPGLPADLHTPASAGSKPASLTQRLKHLFVG